MIIQPKNYPTKERLEQEYLCDIIDKKKVEKNINLKIIIQVYYIN